MSVSTLPVPVAGLVLSKAEVPFGLFLLTHFGEPTETLVQGIFGLLSCFIMLCTDTVGVCVPQSAITNIVQGFSGIYTLTIIESASLNV